MRNCRLFTSFLLVFLGLLLPATVIWWLERFTWADFLDAEPEAVAWPGGPTPEELRSALAKLRQERRSLPGSLEVGADWRLAIVLVMASAALWQLLELAI